MARQIIRKQPGDAKRAVVNDSTRSQQRREAKRLPLLTYDEEIAFYTRIQAGDRHAVGELVERNLALAMDYAARYMGSRLTVGALCYDDVYQNACIGLIEAAKRYNGQHRFSTYATWWMRQSVNRGTEEQADAIRIPSYLHTSRRVVNRAEDAGQTAEQVDLDRAAALPDQPLSLDLAVYVGHAEQVSLADLIGDEDADKTGAMETRLDAIEVLHWIHGHLTELEWRIFNRRIHFDERATLEEIGGSDKRETIRMVEKRTRLKLCARGLCPDGAIRPHGPLARAARRELAEIAENHRVSQRRRKSQPDGSRLRTPLYLSA